MKFETLIKNQEELLSLAREQSTLQRNILSSRMGGSGDTIIEDVLPKQLDSQKDLEDFSTKLEETTYRKKVVSAVLY